jgi:signal transduction histidine kinase
MPGPSPNRSLVRYIMRILLVAAGYFILARLSLLLSFQTSNASPVWPPSGFAFALILLSGYRITPGILLGAFAANFVVFQVDHGADMGRALWVSFIISIGNTSEAIIGYFLLKKLVPHVTDNNYFKKVNDIFYFFSVAIIMSLAAGTIGTASIYFGRFINPDQQFIAWLTWWFGDVSGILLITPFILLWRHFFKRHSKFLFKVSRALETAALFFLVIVVSEIIFNNWFSPPFIFKWAFWIIPVVVWAASRFSQHETITAILLCSAIAIWGTINGHGPFANAGENKPTDLSLNESLLTTQAYISIIAITTLTLHASIIERKKTERALRELGNELEKRVNERTAELEQTNKDLESFTFVASHDLQEPLRKIRIFLNLISEKDMSTLSDQSKNYLERTINTASQMQTLITDLLTYSRTTGSEEHFQKTDLNSVMEKVKSELKELIEEKKAQIEVNNLPALKVIPFQFEQLFTNLISNSLKFSMADVKPQIIISAQTVNGTLLGFTKEPTGKNYHCISISDNGIGFETKYNEKIFDLFQRLHSRSDYHGSGIGLSICKRIVENHKGSITAEGKPGKGATFNIYLPAD